MKEVQKGIVREGININHINTLQGIIIGINKLEEDTEMKINDINIINNSRNNFNLGNYNNN